MRFNELSHELRQTLNDEVHARPSDKITTPSKVVSIAGLSGAGIDEHERLNALLAALGGAAQARSMKHMRANLDGCRLRWEKHTEFARYAFTFPHDDAAVFSDEPLKIVPQGWLQGLLGRLVTAVQLSVLPMPDEGVDIDAISERHFSGNTLIGSTIAGGRAVALTDFRIHDDGFSRILVLNEAMPQLQVGRYVQRLMELETYRMMALLALPVAQGLFPKLNSSEKELAAINESLIGSGSEQESQLLERLTVLAASNESRHAATDFRLSAAQAYYDIVLQRNTELREERIIGTQTFSKFATRRLTPAIKTCRTVAERQQSLVARMARATQLLSTRIDVERQRQNSLILESLNRRMQNQLRLQATVEGISVAAVTYYVVGLIGTLSENLAKQGVPVNTALVYVVAIPLVAGTVFYFVRRIRHGIEEDPE